MTIRSLFSGFAILSLMLIGCHAQLLAPTQPSLIETIEGRTTELHFDMDADGRVDYLEFLDQQGVATRLRFGPPSDDHDQQTFYRRAEPATTYQHLYIIVDSIPYELVMDAWASGRFRLFSSPTKVISTFPAMTDLAINEFFGVSPAKGVESAYFDGERKSNGFAEYLRGANARWMGELDFALTPTSHAQVYLWPRTSLIRELSSIRNTLGQSDEKNVFTYVLATSALGSVLGQSGHAHSLDTLERFCRRLIYEHRGQLHITLLSDHGHSLQPAKYVSLQRRARQLGYLDRARLQSNGDIVLTRYGPVTMACVHTKQPRDFARDIVTLEEVELASFRQGNTITVVSRDGQARITRTEQGYRYECDSGDPLDLDVIVNKLRSRGKILPDGSIEDRALFDATVDHTFPDPAHRLWRGFNGLVEHTPDVLLSLDEEYVFGTRFFNVFVSMASAHGSLKQRSSAGFVMSTVGSLPGAVRMEDLARALEMLVANR